MAIGRCSHGIVYLVLFTVSVVDGALGIVLVHLDQGWSRGLVVGSRDPGGSAREGRVEKWGYMSLNCRHRPSGTGFQCSQRKLPCSLFIAVDPVASARKIILRGRGSRAKLLVGSSKYSRQIPLCGYKCYAAVLVFGKQYQGMLRRCHCCEAPFLPRRVVPVSAAICSHPR